MFRSSVIALLCLSTSCHCIHQPGHQQLGPQKYEIEEDSSKQNALPYQRTILAPKAAYDQNQLNQHYQQYHLHHLNQLQQQNVAQPQAHQYLAALQQFYDASKQPQAYSSAPAQAQAQQPQFAPQSAPSQQYPQPLGVLYSAASDVSQFHFSGNGVNYSF